jgi:hypothetical protein
VLVAHDVVASTLASGEGVPEDDKILLDCPECVSYVKVSIGPIVIVGFLFF